jgi:galactose mutarotase-like enzyme
MTAVISAGSARAEFVPELGMVCASLRDGERELLDQRRGLEPYRERGKTMGIPLLYPWANRLAWRNFKVAGRPVTLPEPGTTIGIDEHGLPIHGAQARLMRWEATAQGGALEAELRWCSAELLAIFPFAHSVQYRAQLEPGPELTIEVTVRADAGDPVPVAFGLHPYLRLPPAADEIELPACDRLGLDGQGLPDGTRAAFGPGRFALDRAWDDALVFPRGPARLAAPGLEVNFEAGFGYGQVFSPEGAGFVCFEPMTAPANALISGDRLQVLEPDQQFQSRVRITWAPS